MGGLIDGEKAVLDELAGGRRPAPAETVAKHPPTCL